MKSSSGSAVKLLRIAVSLLLLTAFYLSTQAFRFTEKQTPLLPLKLDAKKTSIQHNYSQEELDNFLESVAPSLGIDGKKGGIGGESPDAVTSRFFNGKMANDNFGNSIASAGDVNGDGYPDILIGAYWYNSSQGRAYIYYTGPNMDNIADLIMTGAAANDQFGYSVSTAGDVNGDGYADVIVGAPKYEFLGTDAGAAFIYFGAQFDPLAGIFIIKGQNAGDEFGSSVSTAGDVNGDGYDDIIIGAPLNDAGGTNAGAAYIYYGGFVFNLTADVSIIGINTGSDFGAGALGYSVSTAGDVNKDGYDDVIVGAPYAYAAGGVQTGIANLYFGGSNMDNIADMTYAGESDNDFFGSSLSTAGDINNDGYDDIIIGAHVAEGYLGRAYLYLSSSQSVAPSITSVKDIPYDQGGYVKLNWRRSGYDAKDVNKITTYTDQRSGPPAMRGYVWEDIGTVIARKETEYTFTAATPYDSSSSSGGTLHFRIIANTTNSGEFWISNVMSGHSVDNLPPSLVLNFYLEYYGASNKLGWRRNSEPDIRQYNIYRTLTETVDPLTQPVYMTNNDTTIFDAFPLTGKYYYHIAAKDINDNIGPVSTVLSPNVQVNVIMFIEGFFNGTNNITPDTITAYLVDSWTPYTKKDTFKAILKTDGTTTLNFFNVQMGSYYLIIKHRNALETWSRDGGEVFTKGSTAFYNFTTSSNQAYGSNMVYKGTKWCIYSGDVNQDGQINLDDLLSIDVDNQNFETGYRVTDINGDEQITLDDLLITDVNNQNFISVQKPGGKLKKVNKE